MGQYCGDKLLWAGTNEYSWNLNYKFIGGHLFADPEISTLRLLLLNEFDRL